MCWALQCCCARACGLGLRCSPARQAPGWAVFAKPGQERVTVYQLLRCRSSLSKTQAWDMPSWCSRPRPSGGAQLNSRELATAALFHRSVRTGVGTCQRRIGLPWLEPLECVGHGFSSNAGASSARSHRGLYAVPMAAICLLGSCPVVCLCRVAAADTCTGGGGALYSAVAECYEPPGFKVAGCCCTSLHGWPQPLTAIAETCACC